MSTKMMMICEVSSSNPLAPPPHAAASSSSNSSSLLAPGFRFHPTDEELVSYYLKRKVSGLPLRVDAIAEVDLYKREPWDLPSLSRLRTRDMEWYFFSPLDRKYANRSRTNRATVEGYWKTTGKDRPVRHASKVVGMKKTLVFHHGRAPRGKRTNWVMHEYRLEDPQLHTGPAALALPQGSFVVCRIFQKSSSGPQNGAQYGAPFIEGEWEEAENLVPKSEGASDLLMNTAGEQDYVQTGEQDYVQSDDFVKKQPRGIQHEGMTLIKEDSEERDGGSHADDATISLEDILDLDTFIEVPGHGTNNTDNMGENCCKEEQSHSPPGQNDGYLELNDICGNANGPCTINSFDGLPGMQNDNIIENGVNEATTWSQVDDNEFSFDIANEAANAQELSHMCLPADSVFDMQPIDFHNPVAGDYPSGRLTEDDSVFCDAPNAPNNHPPYTGDVFMNTNDIQFLPGADLDEILAFFDATDDNLQWDFLDSSEKSEFVNSATTAQSNSVSEVEGSSRLPGKATVSVPGTSIERGPSSSTRFIGPTDRLESVNEDNSAVPDMQVNDSWNKALRRRAVDILSSISAPPAMAEGSGKGKVDGPLSAARSSSSIHVSAQLIEIHDVTVMRSAGRWTLQKNGGVSFLLSYGMAASDAARKSVYFEPVTKMQGGALTMLLRGGFYLFGLSVLILSASFKMGMCVYSK